MSNALVRRAVGRLRRTLTGIRSVPDPARPPVVGYVVAGADGAHPASAHVRVVRRTEHLAASGVAEVRQVDPSAVLDGTDTTAYRSVLVQRDALRSDLVEPFLTALRARAVRVVAEVDDDFFTASGRDRLARAEYDPDRLASIDALVRAADTVVVSTDELDRLVRPIARQTVVVPNALDPTLWTVAADGSDQETDDDRPTGEHRVLYMGTLTHAADLALLRDVFTDLVAADGLPVRLEVIGVTEDADGGWYRRIEVPDGHYPAFARWLVTHRRRWRAGVAPLEDAVFNRAKSDLKAIEYTALDLPAVVSDRPSYRLAGQHGVTTVPDDPAAWRAAVVAAVARGHADPAAAAWVRDGRFVGRDGDAWRDLLLG
ncbi:hypothetical protein [Curtobacterium sp. ER1/6]|uniref:hypothetical protein n=1 Tax=Curtobacterium sp. ER1/6 TaxID=1891920 RepID=UPI00084FA2CD|nr:hypothetical protein [Curtobacterium sp. ER1/6]OEI68687.1 hypothetical protein Cus16_1793 [Curtobacterium sp. ER1/6]